MKKVKSTEVKAQKIPMEIPYYCWRNNKKKTPQQLGKILSCSWKKRLQRKKKLWKKLSKWKVIEGSWNKSSALFYRHYWKTIITAMVRKNHYRNKCDFKVERRKCSRMKKKEKNWIEDEWWKVKTLENLSIFLIYEFHHNVH